MLLSLYAVRSSLWGGAAYEVMITRGLGKSFWKMEYSVSIKHGLWTTDYGLRIKHGESGIKYELGYKTRRKVLHWINEHFYKWKLPVIIEVSFKKILNSSFPESARSYRFNHTRLPKKKKKTLKVTKLTRFMNFRMIQAVIKCFERSTAVMQSLISPWKRKEVITTGGIRIWSPIQVLTLPNRA